MVDRQRPSCQGGSWLGRQSLGVVPLRGTGRSAQRQGENHAGPSEPREISPRATSAPLHPDAPMPAIADMRTSDTGLSRTDGCRSAQAPAPIDRPLPSPDRSCERWRALVDALVVSRPLALSQGKLLHLAGRVHRQFAELDLGRALEVSEVVAAELDDLLLRHLHPRHERDERLGTLAPLLIRNGNHGARQDGGMADDDLLHLDGRDILPAGDDDVLLPVTQFDVAIGMHDRQIPGVEPAAGEGAGGRLRIAIVALHGVVAAHEYLAQGLAIGGDISHLVVDDADIVRDEVADSLPGLHPRPLFRGKQVPLWLPLADGVWAIDFGEPVDVDDLGA